MRTHSPRLGSCGGVAGLGQRCASLARPAADDSYYGGHTSRACYDRRPLTHMPAHAQVEDYYPKPIHMMNHPLVRKVLHEEWHAEMMDRRKLGKGPPKKGAGKKGKKK